MNLILMNEDVTNSPKDWEDFWNSPETYDEWRLLTKDLKRYGMK